MQEAIATHEHEHHEAPHKQPKQEPQAPAKKDIPTIYTLPASQASGVLLLGKDANGQECYYPLSLIESIVAKNLESRFRTQVGKR